MKILSISPIFPYPIHTGGTTAFFHITDYLRKYHDFTIITIKSKKENIEELKKLWNNVNFLIVEPKPAVKANSKKKGFLHRIIHYVRHPELLFKWIALQDEGVRRMPYSHSHIWSMPNNFVKVIKQELKRDDYDLIIGEFTTALDIGNRIEASVPFIFVHQELVHICEERALETLGWWNQLLLLPQRKRKKRAEFEYLRAFDHLIVFSENDKTALTKDKSLSNKISISPFAIDFEQYLHLNQHYSYHNRLIFLGGESHYPNRDAMFWFVNKVWKNLHVKFPKQELRILSKWNIDTQKILKRDAPVNFIGYVENLLDEFEGSIMVVPLRIGSGIRTKILEAFASGVPVITTSIGVEGIPVTNRVHCLIADTPREFEKAIEVLVTDKGLQKKLVNNARTFVKENYQIERCGSRRKEILEHLVRASDTVSVNS